MTYSRNLCQECIHPLTALDHVVDNSDHSGISADSTNHYKLKLQVYKLHCFVAYVIP
jgi:hypothetical protein